MSSGTDATTQGESSRIGHAEDVRLERAQSSQVQRAERDAAIASTVMDLRSPLSRIELAASRLFREDMPPRAQDLAATIREAVSVIDGQLDAALQALAPPSPPRPAEALGPVLVALAERMSPVLSARGFALQIEEVPELLVEPSQTRRIALVLARVAMELAEPGVLLLTAEEEGGGHAVAVQWAQATMEGAPSIAARAAQQLALAMNGRWSLAPGRAEIWVLGEAENR